MKYKSNLIILFTCLFLYGLNQLFFKNMNISFFNFYFNDLLAVPLFFSLVNIVSLRNINKEITSFKHLFLITIILSILGEYVAIFLRSGSVTDGWDVVCYFIGMFLYYLIKKL